MEVLFLIVVLALITIIICVTAGVISNRKKGGSEEMGLSGLRSGKFCKIFPVRSLRGRKTLN